MTRDLADIAADLSEVEIKVKWAARVIGHIYADGKPDELRFREAYWDLRQAHTLLGKLIEELGVPSL